MNLSNKKICEIILKLKIDNIKTFINISKNLLYFFTIKDRAILYNIKKDKLVKIYESNLYFKEATFSTLKSFEIVFLNENNKLIIINEKIFN